ncbi:IS110 family transposase [Streptomyces mirabilis]|uniref:IS110 family transposase n=1 Tax=Streptomyces mirabilis TaxID=68239 RepID=UPI0036D9701B
MATIWAGIDAGKTHHHCVAIDESGRRLLSRRVANDEPELLQLLADVLALGDEVTWGIDLADGGAALAITILFNHEQPVHYLSGRAIHRASESYRGEGKTDWEHHRVRGALRLVGPKDRSAPCLVSDASASRSTSLRGAGRVRCGLIEA